MVRVKQTFHVEPVKRVRERKPKVCCFLCPTAFGGKSAIGPREQAEFIDFRCGTQFSDLWTAPDVLYNFCHDHFKQIQDAKEEFQSLNVVTDTETHLQGQRLKPPRHSLILDESKNIDEEQTTTEEAPKDADESIDVSEPACEVCGLKEGVMETIDNHLLAQHIDKILGCHISENWKGCAQLCLGHILEYKEKKAELADEFVSKRIPKCQLIRKTPSTPLIRQCLMCSNIITPSSIDTVRPPPGCTNFYCSPCTLKMEKAQMMRRCCICGCGVRSDCVEINDVQLKKKLDSHFHTKFHLNDQPLHLCAHHWVHQFNIRIAERLIPKLPKMPTAIRRCLVCWLPIGIDFCVHIQDKEMKRKFNEHFGSKCVTNDDSVYYVCHAHWKKYSEKEERVKHEQARLLRVSIDFGNKYTVVKWDDPVVGKGGKQNESRKIFHVQRTCCVCGIQTSIHSNAGVRITDPQVKQKLNDCFGSFGTKLTIDEEVLFVCREHWKAVELNTTTKESRRMSNIQSSCCVCGVQTGVPSDGSVQITNPQVKEKVSRKTKVDLFNLNERFGSFGRKLVMNTHALFVCREHWNAVEPDITKEKTAEVDGSNSMLLNSEVPTSKQEIKDEIVELFGNSMKEEHQSIDTKEMTVDRYVKDEVINVEQLIGQPQSIIGPGSDSVPILDSQISLKQEIKEELE